MGAVSWARDLSGLQLQVAGKGRSDAATKVAKRKFLKVLVVLPL
jgi:hypothetical protein